MVDSPEESGDSATVMLSHLNQTFGRRAHAGRAERGSGGWSFGLGRPLRHGQRAPHFELPWHCPAWVRRGQAGVERVSLPIHRRTNSNSFGGLKGLAR
jgi:hypothetical protein